MRVFTVLLLALATAGGCAAAGTGGSDPDRAPLVLPAALDPWLEGYALHPEPDRVVEALALARRSGRMDEGDLDPLLVGFTAEVFRTHPDRIDDWVDSLPAATAADRQFLQLTLWLCATDEGARRLKALRASMEPRERDGHATWAFDLLRMPVRTIPLAAPPILDFLWGTWLASGDPVPVRRIVGVLPWTASKVAAFREVGEAARASLLDRATRDPRVRRILLEEADRLPGAEGAALRELIESLPAASTSRPPD